MRMYWCSLFLFIIPFKSYCCRNDVLCFPDGPTQKILSAVVKAQSSLKAVSYQLKRQDSLVTGDNRTMKGKVIMLADHNDATFGFLFWAKKEGDPGETIYDGHLGYITENKNKKYKLIRDSFALRAILYNGGGQMVVPDLVKLDTSRSMKIISSGDADHFILTIIDNKSVNFLTEYKSEQLIGIIRNHIANIRV